MKRFPIRKLTTADGEYILHHAIEHLIDLGDVDYKQQIAIIKCGPASPCEICQAIGTCRRLISEMISGELSSFPCTTSTVRP